MAYNTDGSCCPVPGIGTNQHVAALLLWIVRLLRGLREGVGGLLGSWVGSLSRALVIHRWVRHVVLAICIGVVAHGHGHLAIPGISWIGRIWWSLSLRRGSRARGLLWRW